MAYWSSDVKEWKPINHSCDPNIWFENDYSLSCSARRHIPEGVALTMDYATFTTQIPDFDCQCGTEACRKRILTTDYLNHSQKYGDHVTYYVKSKVD